MVGLRLRGSRSRKVYAASKEAILWALCQLNQTISGRRPPPGWYLARVLGGPLRGRPIFLTDLHCIAFALGTHERPVVRAIQTFVRVGATAYDIGANVGYISLIIAKTVGRMGTVFSFEASSNSYQVLRENIRINSFDNIVAVPRAVTKDSGWVNFANYEFSLVSKIADESIAEDAMIERVECVSLDDFVYRDKNLWPDFIKIDVEGGELDVLIGAERVIRERKPIIVAEIWRDKWPEVSRLLDSYDYLAQRLPGYFDFQQDGLSEFLLTPK
jgi:FkbM family methyltransferase